jgi:hypothetical protein
MACPEETTLDSTHKNRPIEHVIDPHPEYPKSAAAEPTLRHVSCHCGMRLMIAMIIGTRKECLCGAILEITPQGMRTL